jgi:hypothetical protein
MVFMFIYIDVEVGEVQRVLEERGMHVRVLCRENATRHKTLSACQGAQWMHLAAHVEESQLLLAQSADPPERPATCGGEDLARVGAGEGKGEGEAVVEEAVCTCKYKGECNHGDCACCNAAQRCWGCSAECRKGGKAAALGGGGGGKAPQGDEVGFGASPPRAERRETACERRERERDEAEGGGRKEGRSPKGKNSLREARERREREEKREEKTKRKPIVRVDKADNGVVLPEEVAHKVRLRAGSTVVLSAKILESQHRVTLYSDKY